MKMPTHKKVLFTLAEILLIIVVLEVSFIFILAKKKPPERVIPKAVMGFHEITGWQPAPNRSAVSNKLGYPIEYRINSFGLRDAETTLEKPSGIFRIVLVGDSNTFGFGIAIKKHFSTLLEKYFNSVEVLNLGVEGYGVGQELLHLRHIGFTFEPDLVLAYIPHYGGHRHMHSKRFGKGKPQFILKDGQLRLINFPVPNPFAPSMETAVQRPKDKIHDWLLIHSATYLAIIDGVKSTSELFRLRREAKNQDALEEKDKQDPQFLQQLHELGERIVFEMDSKTKDNHATFVLVTKMDRLHTKALERGISSLNVNLSLPHSRYAISEKMGHINAAGNAILAEEIARFLINQQLIPEKHLK